MHGMVGSTAPWQGCPVVCQNGLNAIRLVGTRYSSGKKMGEDKLTVFFEKKIETITHGACAHSKVKPRS